MADCFECGAPAEHDHHVVPKSRGGTKTVPLCTACHGSAHELRMPGRVLTKDALAYKKAKGERVGAIPYGYHLAADGVNLEPDTAEQAMIAKARALRAAGLSLRKVGECLAERGMLPRTGKAWHAQQVQRLLSDEVAA